MVQPFLIYPASCGPLMTDGKPAEVFAIHCSRIGSAVENAPTELKIRPKVTNPVPASRYHFKGIVLGKRFDDVPFEC